MMLSFSTTVHSECTQKNQNSDTLHCKLKYEIMLGDEGIIDLEAF